MVERRRPARATELLDASMRAFAVAGYFGTSTAQVAEEMGVSQPYVIRTFGSKRELFLQTHVHAGVCILDVVRASAGGVFGPARLGAAYLELIVSNRPAVLVHAHAFSAAAADPVIAQEARRLLDEIFRTVVAAGSSVPQAAAFISQSMFASNLLLLDASRGADRQELRTLVELVLQLQPEHLARPSRVRSQMTHHVAFTDNYRDLSNQDGYQFEFRCERCGNGFRSAFRRDPRAAGQKLARGLSSFLGGPLAEVGSLADRLLDRGTNSSAKDDALRTATAEIAPHFHQCRGCGDWVCGDGCWNAEIGQCVRCSPVSAEELARLQADARRRQLQERLDTVDLVGGVPLGQQSLPRCPACDAQTHGGKFCQDCGSPLTVVRTCTGCGTETAAGGRFCPECGQRFS